MNLVTGAVLSRHQIYVHVAGEDVNVVVNGAAMLGNGQLADSTLLADHAAVGGVGREQFKTVIDGDATGVFQGKIIVRQVAQKTDGKMKSDCLLLTDEGQMMNKPELEIFADDVACGHGATCGAPDQDLLFYLMARGLPQPDRREPAGSGLRRRGGGIGHARGRPRGADRRDRGLARGAGLNPSRPAPSLRGRCPGVRPARGRRSRRRVRRASGGPSEALRLAPAPRDEDGDLRGRASWNDTGSRSRP